MFYNKEPMFLEHTNGLILDKEIKNIGYITQKNIVDIDVDDISKEKILRYHSEKLAVAFTLMSLPS